MKRSGMIAVGLLIVLAFLLLASLYWYNDRSGRAVSASNLLTVEAGKLLGGPGKASALKLDLNANRIPETLFYLPAGNDTGLHQVRALVVLELVKRKPNTVLLVSKEGIFSRGTQRVVDQLPAEAYRVQVMQGGAALRLQLLNAAGTPISDDVALRWNTATAHFVAE